MNDDSDTPPQPKWGKLQSGDRSHYPIALTRLKEAAIFQGFYPPETQPTETSYPPPYQPPSQIGLVHGSPNSNKRKKSDVYSEFHHYIPRFVLKKFTPSESGSNQARPKASTYINCYSKDDPSGQATMHQISKAYGIKDLYKDTKNPEDAYALESELSTLENKANRIIAHILGGRPKGKGTPGGIPATSTPFRTSRKNFNSLQKFLYIMGYRKASIAKTYWQQDHPENARLNPWIESFIKLNKISATPVNTWLYLLGYLLRTPHEEIVEHGRKARSNLAYQASEYPHSPWNRSIDPGLKHLEAIEYMVEADGCFLAIWEAAPGEEFIISSNSFGILEGKESVWGPIHRFYIISPRIALVICSTGLDPDFCGNPQIKELCLSSTFLDAVHKPPKVEHATKPPEFECYRERLAFEAKSHTWLDDMMEFEISTLSVEHTRTINAIILENVNDGGMVTFRSKEAFIQTLDSFSKNRYFSNHSRYDLLLKGLRESIQLKSPPDPEEKFHSNNESYGVLDQESSGDNYAHQQDSPPLSADSEPKISRAKNSIFYPFILILTYFLSYIQDQAN